MTLASGKNVAPILTSKGRLAVASYCKGSILLSDKARLLRVPDLRIVFFAA